MNTEIWVDGSFTNDTPCWAFLVKQDGIEVHRESGFLNDPKLKRYYQIAGELAAAQEAMNWAIKNNIKDVTISYDYEGIRSWAVKAWKANNPLTQSYVENTTKALMSLNVIWNKIQAHSGNKENEIVDKMAKLANTCVLVETSPGIIEICHKNINYIIDLNNLTVRK